MDIKDVNQAQIYNISQSSHKTFKNRQKNQNLENITKIQKQHGKAENFSVSDEFKFQNILKNKLNNYVIQNDIVNANKKGLKTTDIVNNSDNFNSDPDIDINAEEKSVTFSKHAQQRLINRNIEISEEFIENIDEAISKAAQKKIKNALMISNTNDSAFIVNVDSKTVITAININEMRNNIITNIDGTVII